MIILMRIDFSHDTKSELNRDTDRVSCFSVVIVDSGESNKNKNKRAANKMKTTTQQKTQKINFYRNLIHRIVTVVIIVIVHACEWDIVSAWWNWRHKTKQKIVELKRKLRCFAYFLCMCVRSIKMIHAKICQDIRNFDGCELTLRKRKKNSIKSVSFSSIKGYTIHL